MIRRSGQRRDVDRNQRDISQTGGSRLVDVLMERLFGLESGIVVVREVHELTCRLGHADVIRRTSRFMIELFAIAWQR
jgi:hypothetical protein